MKLLYRLLVIVYRLSVIESRSSPFIFLTITDNR